MSVYNITKAKNIAGPIIKAKLVEIGISIKDIISIINDYGIIDISDDRISAKLNGNAPISDVELIMWAKLLKCTVEELMETSALNPNIENASNEVFRRAAMIKEIDSLQPIVTWHPDKLNLTKNGYISWDTNSRKQLCKFYNDFGMDLTVKEYNMPKSKIAVQISYCRRNYPELLANPILDHKSSPKTNFINYYNNYGAKNTAIRYGLAIKKVKEYARYINYINSI